MILRSLMPERYYNSPQMACILDAIDCALTAAQTAVYDLLAQLNLQTATWALELYERDYGLSTDVSQSFTERRSRIAAKMRGAGTATIAALQNIADAYVNGTSQITDLAQLFTLCVQFHGEYGVPSNLEACQKALEAARPAHMQLQYAFRYLLIRDIHLCKTLSAMEEIPLNHFAG